ncbi:MAG TPA: SRPBCC family protein [Bryobacteraceae bacterium]|nr:SRPBCC family protein [Bryobacteraceae bacterium]
MISPSNHYRFITRWRMRATAEEVYAILSQPVEYPRWWPSVYLTVRELKSGDPTGKGKEVQVHTKGWLPYTLYWKARTTESNPPYSLAITASGDFAGRGIWSIVPDGEYVDITFDWKLSAEKPLLRFLSFLLKPAFEANHRWAMEEGERDLELELRRGRANSVEEMNSIAAPAAAGHFPGRATIAGVALVTALAAVTAVSPVRRLRRPVKTAQTQNAPWPDRVSSSREQNPTESD